jgi:hypothetical protein
MVQPLLPKSTREERSQDMQWGDSTVALGLKSGKGPLQTTT